jgi:hypothetical protein
MNFYKIFLLLTLFSSVLISQNKIYGKITSASNGEAIVGTNVIVENTKFGFSTNIDGEFTIINIPDGTYNLKITGVGYESQKITGITLKAGESKQFNIALKENSLNFSEVVVSADKVNSTDAAVLSERKKSGDVRDVISAEQITKTPDGTSSEALKRVTGLTLVDNKFIYVRGVSDRYNGTMLDGSIVSSTEAGKKSFSFDLIPANLLENASVIKTATPDLSGDFSGGLVQMNTLDFPEKRVISLSLGSSYNSITTGKEVFHSNLGVSEWLGFDGGSRQFPVETSDINDIARNTQNNWAPKGSTAPPNTSFALSLGDKIFLSDDVGSQEQLGFVLSLTYKNSFSRNDRRIDDISFARYNTGIRNEFTSLWGVLANFSLRLGALHKINFRNNFNQSSADEVSQINSQDSALSLYNQFTVLEWSERSLYSGQLSGEHSFPGLGMLKIDWRVGISSSKREDPDRKEITYYRDIYDPSAPLTAAVNQRSWSKLNDKSNAFDLNFSLPIENSKIKSGIHFERKNTGYSIRYFNVVPDYFGGIPDSLVQLPLETIYSHANFGKKKFQMSESSHPSDSYTGDLELFASYMMADFSSEIFSKKIRFIGGVRLENSSQKVLVPKSLDGKTPPTESLLREIDYLPSLNFTLTLVDNLNFRTAYYHSVNRPDFRELASTSFFDFIKYELVAGNPNLTRSYIKNIDFRLEYFPGTEEVIAISYFDKQFSGAIEERLFQSSVRTRSWFNSDQAANRGWELEVRKNLGFISEYLEDLSIIGNYSQVTSEVLVTETRGNSSHTESFTYSRPLQGQSPYTINLSLLYNNRALDLSVNLLYNKFGRRLDAVGFLTSDIYEEPRELIDLAINKKIFENLDLKFTIKNLTNKDRILTRDDKLFEQTSYGTSYSIQFGYKF